MKASENHICKYDTTCDSENDQIEKAAKDFLSHTPSLRIECPYPILPQEGKHNILITSALPYVNNVPHLGNIIGSVLSADVFARYCRLKNLVTLYVCGTDEYGTATEIKAHEEGISPLEICDKYHKIHKAVYQWFNISFDHFGRTTTPAQTVIAQDIFFKLYNGQFIFTDTMDQLHCQACQRFMADRYVEGTCPLCKYPDARGDQCDKCGKLMNAIELIQPKCKICGNTPTIKSVEHLYLDLPKLEGRINSWFTESVENEVDNKWTPTASVITKSWLKSGLKPRCITRDLKWGTPVPLEGFEDKVFYVWYDAPIGYLSITANYTKDWELWWKNPAQVTLYNFMAKDNVPFHSVIFPSCLLGTGDNYTLVNHLIATEYLNYEDRKFSKSRQIGVFGGDAKETGIPSDIWRFYLLSIRPETQDSNFNWQDMGNKVNGELLNNLGNFINRSLSFVAQFYKGVVPPIQQLESSDKLFIQKVNEELKRYTDLMDRIKIREGLYSLLEISHLGNQYIQDRKPWVFFKGKNLEDKIQAATVISIAINTSFLLATLLEPFAPVTSNEIFAQLGADLELKVLPSQFGITLGAGHQISQPKPLFTKLEPSLIEKLKVKFAGAATEKNGHKAKIDEDNSLCQSLEALGIKSISDLANIPKDELAIVISKQGELVRALKANKAPKDSIQKEVVLLLKLKKMA